MIFSNVMKIIHKNSQFFLFSLVGALGFFVDAFFFMLLINKTLVGLYWGRVFSFIIAATFTWLLNRKYTFKPQSKKGIRELLYYFSIMAIGGAINFLIYSLLLQNSFFFNSPIFAVALGSASGLSVNFLLSSKVLYRNAKI